MMLPDAIALLHRGKHRTTSAAVRVVPAMLAAAVLLACGKSDGNRILGHWRAERFVAQGISMPMGPEFEITPHAVRSPDGEIEIPVSAITAKGDQVTLEGPLSIGLSFHFEEADRISLDLPFVGKLYYRRVSNPSQTAARSSNNGTAPTSTKAPKTANGANSGMPQHKPVTAAVPAEARSSQIGKHAASVDPMDDYQRACASMREGDADSAVRHLHAGFQHGFRRFDLLEASVELAPLKADPRYVALLARYR